MIHILISCFHIQIISDLVSGSSFKLALDPDSIVHIILWALFFTSWCNKMFQIHIVLSSTPPGISYLSTRLWNSFWLKVRVLSAVSHLKECLSHTPLPCPRSHPNLQAQVRQEWKSLCLLENSNYNQDPDQVTNHFFYIGVLWPLGPLGA